MFGGLDCHPVPRLRLARDTYQQQRCKRFRLGLVRRIISGAAIPIQRAVDIRRVQEVSVGARLAGDMAEQQMGTFVTAPLPKGSGF